MKKAYAIIGVVFATLGLSSTPGTSQPTSQARESPSLILTAKIPLPGVFWLGIDSVSTDDGYSPD